MLYDLGLYADRFEVTFLEATAAFYSAEAAAKLAESDVPTYLSHVRSRLSQEEARVAHYMHLSTRKGLIHTSLTTLLAAHVDAILEKGFAPLMEQMRLDDLTRMYHLYAMVDALPKLRQVKGVEEAVRRA